MTLVRNSPLQGTISVAELLTFYKTTFWQETVTSQNCILISVQVRVSRFSPPCKVTLPCAVEASCV